MIKPSYYTKYQIAIASMSLLVASCANNPLSSYKSTSDQQLQQVYQGSLTPASAESNTSDVLANLEDGTLARLARNYSLSNQHYQLAEQVVEEWNSNWLNTTQGQISTQTLALLVNDNANAYDPHSYEKTFLATFHALNHLSLNNWSNARVEIKRMYQTEQALANYNQVLYAQAKLDASQQQHNSTTSYLNQQLLQKYDFSDLNTPAVLALKNSYQNAFSHYLAGFVFEALAEPSLARPGYIKAGQLNPNATLIQTSIDHLDQGVRPPANTTELLIVQETGHAPQLQSIEAHIPLTANLSGNKNGCLNMINIFYPKLIVDHFNDNTYPLIVDNTNLELTPMVDVNLMAARALKDQLPHLLARNIAAAIRNLSASQLVCSNGNSIGSLLSIGASLGSMLLDRADERSWTLLPAQISIARTNLSYGKHQLRVIVDGVPHFLDFKLNQPYQVVSLRIMGKQVFFVPQQSMVP